jgi:hypothetical protein
MAFQPGLKIKRMKKGILKGLELEKFLFRVQGVKVQTYFVSIRTNTNDDLARKIILLKDLIQPDNGIDWRHVEISPGTC